MNTMQLFLRHLETQGTDTHIDHEFIADEGAVCRFCGLPIHGVAHPLSSVIPDTFTDIEQFRRRDSGVLCHACAVTIIYGKPNFRSEGFWAVQTSEGFISELPWNSLQTPWYLIPEGAPNVLVNPGKAYQKKHRLFRAEACQDARYLGFWNEEIQRFIPRDTMQKLAALEEEWLERGYPQEFHNQNRNKKAEEEAYSAGIDDAIRPILQTYGAGFVKYTVSQMNRRRIEFTTNTTHSKEERTIHANHS